MTPFVLVLDDDDAIGPIISASLGIRAISLMNRSAFATYEFQGRPEACFVDIHLADDNGLDLLATLHDRWPEAAIIVITADPDEHFIGEALASGAHDFLAKPVRPGELKARFKARLAEAKARSVRETMRYADIGFNYRLRRLSHADSWCYLSPLATELLHILIDSRGEVVSKAALKRRMWPGVAVTANSLDQRITELRRALSAVGSSLALQAKYGGGLVLKRHEDEHDKTGVR